MSEYEKVILQKVSFNNDLFKKELIKSIGSMQNEELANFKNWVVDNFFHTHFEEIKEIL
jgi:hypothetical protein